VKTLAQLRSATVVRSPIKALCQFASLCSEKQIPNQAGHLTELVPASQSPKATPDATADTRMTGILTLRMHVHYQLLGSRS